jgi:hypothetical protein
MINVDEVTASRLIFAPMGVFLGKCCGNAASSATTQALGSATPRVHHAAGRRGSSVATHNNGSADGHSYRWLPGHGLVVGLATLGRCFRTTAK